MQNVTLQEKLLNEFKGSKNTMAYSIAKDIVFNEKKSYKVIGDTIRPCYTSGSGRFTSNQNHTQAVIEILEFLEITYTTGNDSPRGGKSGNFIKINL